jgi:hypothetical protein
VPSLNLHQGRTRTRSLCELRCALIARQFFTVAARSNLGPRPRNPHQNPRLRFIVSCHRVAVRC